MSMNVYNLYTDSVKLIIYIYINSRYKLIYVINYDNLCYKL